MFFQKNKNIASGLALAFLLAASFMACVKTDFDEPPVGGDGQDIPTNTTIRDLKSLHEVSGSFDLITDDLVIGGTVVMDDRSGNFYKTLVIQDETGGIEVRFNDGFLYNRYPVGRKIYIRCKGLVLTDYGGLVQLTGSTIQEGSQIRDIGLTELQEREKVVKGFLTAAPAPHPTTLTELNVGLVSTLIRLDDVQFIQPDTGKIYADALTKTTLERTLADCDNNVLVLRTSGFSDFANNLTPGGKGSVTGILGYFNGEYQLAIRDLNDVALGGTRCGGGTLTPNTTIKALKNLYQGNSFEITDALVIEGQIVMDDRSGNYYKTLVIQDATGGIEIKINKTDLYSSFPVGTTFTVDCKNLWLTDYNGLIQLAGDASGQVLGLTDSELAQHIRSQSGTAPAPKVVNISQLNADLVSTLVRFDEVQFIKADTSKTWADAVQNFSINRTLEDCNSLQVIVRTSGFADFADAKTPGAKGSITGVLGIFNGTYQLYIRDLNDVSMSGLRCGAVDPNGPGLATLDEAFTGTTANQDIDLPGWVNVAVQGNRIWRGASFSGDKFASATAFNSSLASMETWLITPAINLTTQKTLSFESSSGYYKHDGLTVWVSTDFNGQNPATATWTQLNFTMPPPNTAGYSDFIPSGNISLPVFNGKGYIGFKYVGDTNTNTTTWRFDDVKVQ